MNKEDRQDWLMDHFAEWALIYGDKTYARFDVLNRDFVNDYIEATGAKAQAMPYGADKCPQLGRDLSELFRHGRLKRRATGLEGMAGMGFPRWVYSYYLP